MSQDKKARLLEAAAKAKAEIDLWDKVVTPLVFSHYGLKPEIQNPTKNRYTQYR